MVADRAVSLRITALNEKCGCSGYKTIFLQNASEVAPGVRYLLIPIIYEKEIVTLWSCRRRRYIYFLISTYTIHALPLCCCVNVVLKLSMGKLMLTVSVVPN